MSKEQFSSYILARTSYIRWNDDVWCPFALLPKCCVLTGEAPNFTFIVFGLIRLGFEPTIYITWGVHDAVYSKYILYIHLLLFWLMVFNAAFNNISVSVSFIGEGNKRTRRKPLTCMHVTDKLHHIMLYTSPWSRFELTSVVIAIDCICSFKSNYHAITATTAPTYIYRYTTRNSSTLSFVVGVYSPGTHYVDTIPVTDEKPYDVIWLTKYYFLWSELLIYEGFQWKRKTLFENRHVKKHTFPVHVPTCERNFL